MEKVSRDTLRIVGIMVRAKWDDLWNKVPEAWKSVFARADEIEFKLDHPFIDVSLEQQGDEYLQVVGALVSQVGDVPAGMCAVEIVRQAYIHHRHEGTQAEIAAAFGAIYEWAEANDHDASPFKIDVGYTPNGDEESHDLYVGLLPLKRWRFVGAIESATSQ